MKENMKYGLDIQLFGSESEDVETTQEVVEKNDPTINLDVLNNKEKENSNKNLSEVDILKKELADERAARQAAEEKAIANKAAFDKAASKAAATNKANRELAAKVQEPNLELQEYREKVAAYELNEKKTSALLGFTDVMGITKDHAQRFVESLYHPDTNELSVPDFMEAFAITVKDVQEDAFKRGYEQSEREQASGKPRSMGKNSVESTPEQKALDIYKQRRNKR